MNKQDAEVFFITDEESGKRVDTILAARYKEIKSRTYFQNLISDHHVLLNGKTVKKQIKPKSGDEVEVYFALTPEMDLIPENLPLEIIFEDENILVINKAPGMVVHPAPGNWSGTFVNALLYHCKHIAAEKGSLRPGIVHRLDKDTSGLLISAKTPLAQQRLIEMFAAREVYKEYLAICVGNPGEGTLSFPIGRHPIHRKQMAVCAEKGREAITKFKTCFFDGKLSVVHCIIETGRTHQIRVHLSHHRTPVLGDSLYGSISMNKKYCTSRQMLHAQMLRLKHPITQQMITFTANPPSDMKEYVKAFKYTE